MRDFPDQPSPNWADTAHTLAKIGIAAVPGVGGVGLELFNAIITPPVAIRREKWVTHLLNEFHSRLLNIEEVAKNPQFVTAFLQALPMVIRTHQQEKHHALHNAVLNVAVSQAPEETLQHIFLHYVDSMAPLHLSVLKYAQDPSVRNDEMEANLTRTRPGDSWNRDIYEQIWNDLFSRGLVTLENLHTVMSRRKEKITSKLGDSFLAFISEPSTADLPISSE